VIEGEAYSEVSPLEDFVLCIKSVEVRCGNVILVETAKTSDQIYMVAVWVMDDDEILI